MVGCPGKQGAWVACCGKKVAPEALWSFSPKAHSPLGREGTWGSAPPSVTPHAFPCSWQSKAPVLPVSRYLCPKLHTLGLQCPLLLCLGPGHTLHWDWTRLWLPRPAWPCCVKGGAQIPWHPACHGYPSPDPWYLLLKSSHGTGMPLWRLQMVAPAPPHVALCQLPVPASWSRCQAPPVPSLLVPSPWQGSRWPLHGPARPQPGAGFG